MIETSSRELMTRSRQLIDSSVLRRARAHRMILRSQHRILPRLRGGSDHDRSSPSGKAPECGHRYVTIELGLDGQWVAEEVDAMRRSMAGLYVSAPYRRNGTPWIVAVCPECADGQETSHRATN